VLMAKGGRPAARPAGLAHRTVAPAPAAPPPAPPQLYVQSALSGKFIKPCSLTRNPFIRLYPDTLSREACGRLLAQFDADKSGRRSGLTGGARGGVYNPSMKRCQELPIGPLSHPDLDRMLGSATKRTFDRYRDEVPVFGQFCTTNPLKDTSFLLQVYQPSARAFDDGADGFGWHIDAGSPQSSNRVLALILYLNDVAEGGETEFSGWREDGGLRMKESEPTLRIRPGAGTALWFPPMFPFEHRGRTPRSSRKAIITSFVVFQ
jgi:hypothetical protein